jgi:deferrochelatase/peroxidase EfeB
MWSHEGDETRWRGREKRLESGEIHVSEHVRSE